MPLETYPDQLEPHDLDVVIWRFVDGRKFRDLIQTGELYFCRADRFGDESEGLPPEEYLPALGLNPLDLNDRQRLDDLVGSVADGRADFYVNCWHLFREETAKMWNEYGNDGVAICSRYRLLRSALDTMDGRIMLGLVRYGWKHLTGLSVNVIRFITTKRWEFAAEREVRAVIWIPDQYAGTRHVDINDRPHPRSLTPPPERVPMGQRRKIDLQAVLTRVIVTPWATPEDHAEIEQLVRSSGYTILVEPSALTRYRQFLPRLGDAAEKGI